MQTMTLEIQESYVEKFLNVLEALPHGVVSLKHDPMRDELSKRIEAIDKDAMSVTPYMEGMDAMTERVKAAHAGR